MTDSKKGSQKDKDIFDKELARTESKLIYHLLQCQYLKDMLVLLKQNQNDPVKYDSTLRIELEVINSTSTRL